MQRGQLLCTPVASSCSAAVAASASCNKESPCPAPLCFAGELAHDPSLEDASVSPDATRRHLALAGDCIKFMFSSSSPDLPDPCAALLRCTMPGEQSCSSTPRVRSEVDRARRPAGSWPQAAHCRGQAAPRRSRGFQRAQEAGKGRERGEKRAGRGADRARTAAGDLAESCVRLGASRGRVSGRERRRPRSRWRRGESLLFLPHPP